MVRALNGVSQLVLMCAEHARGGAELQERDVLALGHRARQLRLDFDDLRIGEPADQVDVMHGKIDDDADIRHARRKRADPGDGDRENVLILDRALDRLDRGIETLDMADHQRHPGAAGGGDDGAALLDRRRDRLLDQDVKAAGDAGQRDIVMQMGRRGDGHRIDAAADQRFQIGEFGAAERAGDKLALLVIGIDHADELNAGHFRQHARMVAAHDADANNANFQRITPSRPAHDRKGSLDTPSPSPSPSMAQAHLATHSGRNLNTFYFRYLRGAAQYIFRILSLP